MYYSQCRPTCAFWMEVVGGFNQTMWKVRCQRRYLHVSMLKKKQASLEAVTVYVELPAPTDAEQLTRRRENKRGQRINPAIIEDRAAR